eukprot:scaffold84192_cov32-Tisochrysis_lutea.AAC.1
MLSVARALFLLGHAAEEWASSIEDGATAPCSPYRAKRTTTPGLVRDHIHCCSWCVLLASLSEVRVRPKSNK